MSNARFYCPELNTDGTQIPLPDAAHRHAVQVLRLKQGERIRLFDGRGLEYYAELTQVAKRSSTVTLLDKVTLDNESPLNITLLQGISRGERMDYALQKAVELGVNRIIPVVTERCNVQLSSGRAEKRLAHWHGVMVSACEQSGRSVLPELSNIMMLDEALADNAITCRFVLAPEATIGFAALEQPDAVSLLIGPEGGLSEQEVQQAITENYQAIKFGPRILRTETATAAAIAVIQTMWGDLG